MANSQNHNRIPLNLMDHKVAIAIPVAVIFTSSCVLPLVLYFVLKDVAGLKMAIVLGIPTGIFGLTSLLSYFRRLHSLLRTHSTTRPINSPRRALDYFHWNFTLGFCYITALITYATATTPPRPRVVSLPLSLLVAQVCIQLVGVQGIIAAGWAYPFRVSSMAKGVRPVRSAVFTIVEDVVAVDGGQGVVFREALGKRYEGSVGVRRLMERLSWFWGVTGLCVAGMDVGLIFGVSNQDVGWVIGWTIPWLWAAVCAAVTVYWTKATLRIEREEGFQGGGPTFLKAGP